MNLEALNQLLLAQPLVALFAVIAIGWSLLLIAASQDEETS